MPICSLIQLRIALFGEEYQLRLIESEKAWQCIERVFGKLELGVAGKWKVALGRRGELQISLIVELPPLLVHEN
jgi:hypothetical protein